MTVKEAVVKQPSRRIRRRNAEIADEPSKSELMEDIRIGLRQALAGEGRPAREAFKELRQKIAGDAHAR